MAALLGIRPSLQRASITAGVGTGSVKFCSLSATAGRGTFQTLQVHNDRQWLVTEPAPGQFTIDCPNPPAT